MKVVGSIPGGTTKRTEEKKDVENDRRKKGKKERKKKERVLRYCKYQTSNRKRIQNAFL